MLKRYLASALLLILTFVSACKSPGPQPAPAPKAAPAGIDKAGMDTTVAPGDDFNAFVNGTWLKTTEIPADKSSYGPGNILSDETRKQTVDLIQGAASANPASADARKVGDFYSSYMDEA